MEVFMRNNKNGTGYSIKAPAKRQDVIVTQTFDAPRDMVFKVYNDPELRGCWWGPERLKTSVEKMDVRPGGSWRIIQQDKDGKTYAFHGLYHTVIKPESVIFTFEFEGMPGHYPWNRLNSRNCRMG